MKKLLILMALLSSSHVKAMQTVQTGMFMGCPVYLDIQTDIEYLIIDEDEEDVQDVIQAAEQSRIKVRIRRRPGFPPIVNRPR